MASLRDAVRSRSGPRPLARSNACGPLDRRAASGVARRVFGVLDAKVAEVGIRTLRLEMNKALHDAQAQYRASGNREVQRFNDEPYAHHWFEKLL